MLYGLNILEFFVNYTSVKMGRNRNPSSNITVLGDGLFGTWLDPE